MRRGGWSGVPLSDCSDEGPYVEVHSKDVVKEVVSLPAANAAPGHLISTRLIFTPEKRRDDRLEGEPAPSPETRRLRRNPLVIPNAVSCAEAWYRKWCLKRIVLWNCGT